MECFKKCDSSVETMIPFLAFYIHAVPLVSGVFCGPIYVYVVSRLHYGICTL